MYEDDNTSYQYEQGQYSTIEFSYSEASQTVTIGARHGSFSGLRDQRTFQFVWVKTDRPVGLGREAQPDQVVQYNGNEVKVKMTN